jgi:hypothetical protein
MKTLIALLLLAGPVLAQKTAPEQGPPPKNLTAHADGRFSANGDPANPDQFEVHVVAAGETLSGIAGEVMKDPRLWPQVWEQNEHIVNPHWIYPNDKVLIRPVTKITEAAPPPPAPAVTPAPTPAPAPEVAPPYVPPAPKVISYPGPGLRANLAPPPPAPAQNFLDLAPPKTASEIKASDLYCSGFVRTTPVTAELKVTSKATNDGSVLSSESDYVYLNQGSSKGIQPGAVYEVIRPTIKVKAPKAKAAEGDLGMHYLEIAQVRVMTAQPEFSMARVVYGCEAIETGDFMVPYEAVNVPVLPRPRQFSSTMKSAGAPNGTVVTTKNVMLNFGTVFKGSRVIPGTHEGPMAAIEQGIAAEGSIIYLDLGKASGAKTGDLFIVYRDMGPDGTLYEMPKDTKGLTTQHRAIGEVVILKVEERAATALVTYAAVGISQGDAVEKR